ncbi:Clavaminate synthase-like protein [Tuber magnatum]|uniref:Clavaminate synthase-like protein n=1 Tax=Tuber magnatum TaxID=42249 RepID=A0A317SZA3_9PEZI|nr:Clavaminate synthase-like protein [Tuber magnatum]
MNPFRRVPRSLLPRQSGRTPQFLPPSGITTIPSPTFLLPNLQYSTSTTTSTSGSTYTSTNKPKKPKLHTAIARDPKAKGARLTNTKRVDLILNGMPHAFDNIFLRDACACAYCVDPSTQQKLFQTSDIPQDVRPLTAMTLDDGALRVTWDPETDIPVANPRRTNHTSLYSAEFLLRYSDRRHVVRHRFNDRSVVLWDRDVMESDVIWLDWEEYFSSDDEGLHTALKALSVYGLFFLKNVPSEESSVERIAQRIGPLKSTFYGKTWDVRSLPESKNIAYTSLNLGLHMDLLYFSSPPGVQFLHCLKNTVTGGESYFADSFRAATAVRMTSHSLWNSLLTYPVPYHYHNDGHHYHHVHPVVVLDDTDYRVNKRISHVNYSPPFQAAFEDAPTDPLFAGRFRLFLRALEMFADGVGNPKAQFDITLSEGVCAVFANRRVLHARRAFDPSSGERWLKGTYVDTDAFLSKVRVLGKKFQGAGSKDEGDYGYVRDV